MAGIEIDGVNNKIDFDDDKDTSISANVDDTLVIESGGANIASITSGEFAINDDQGNIDFRVESDLEHSMLFVDASQHSIGVATGNPVLASGRGIVVDGGSSVARVELRNDTSGDTASDGMFLTYSGTDAFVGNREAGTIQFWNNGSERMRITSGGFIKHKTTGSYVASAQFHEFVNASGSQQVLYLRHTDSSNPYGLQVQFNNAAPDNNNHWFYIASDSGAVRFKVFSDGDVVNHDNAYGAISDERIKQDIRDSNSQWNDIKAVRVRNFKKKDDVRQYGDNAWEQIGVVAQELEAVSPKLIRHNNPDASDILSDSSFGTLWTADDPETQDGVEEVLYTADDPETQDVLYTADDELPEGVEVGDVKIQASHNVGDVKIEAKPSTKQIGDVKEIKEQVKSVNYSVLYMKAVKALQEAMTRIEELETKVEALENA